MLRFVAIPENDLTVDALRTAIYAYITAVQRKEAFVVRIDDTDKRRIVPGKDSDIVQTLERFALLYTRSYHQSERKQLHQSLAVRLLQEKKAYVCTCIANDGTPEDSCRNDCATHDADYAALKKNRTPFAVRLRRPAHASVDYRNVFHGDATAACLTEPLLLDTEGTPTSVFAAACDDMLDDVAFIVEEDNFSEKVFASLCIRAQLGNANDTTCAFLPPLLDDDGAPLANNNREGSLLWLLKQGFLPDALLNYLILLGNPDVPEEIFTLPDALTWFSIEKVPTQPMRFELARLRRINRAHLQRLDARTLSRAVGFGDPSLGMLARYKLDRGASTLEELTSFVRDIFAPKRIDGEDAETLRTLQDLIGQAPFCRDYESFLSWLSQQSGMEKHRLEKPLRRLITGKDDPVDLAAIYPHINAYIMEVVQ